jgi:hypothetical protein
MSTFPDSIAESEEEQVRELAQMMIRQRAALVGPDDTGTKFRIPFTASCLAF